MAPPGLLQYRSGAERGGRRRTGGGSGFAPPWNCQQKLHPRHPLRRLDEARCAMEDTALFPTADSCGQRQREGQPACGPWVGKEKKSER